MTGWKWMDYGGAMKEGGICRRRSSSSSTRTALEALQKRLASRNSHTHYPPRARWQHHIYTCRMSLNSTGLLTSHNSVSVYKFWTESNFSKNCPKFQILTKNNSTLLNHATRPVFKSFLKKVHTFEIIILFIFCLAFVHFCQCLQVNYT